ncbi:MAG: alpha/beta hydrolase [Paracoccaceae bacterium]
MGTIRVHRWGRGKPVVMLHGWTMAGDIWAPVAERLNATCLAPDLPAHGGTTGYQASIDGSVELLDDLLERENLRDVTLVGWSLGALVGWSALSKGAGRIARMVSVDMSPCPLPTPGWAYTMLGLTTAKALTVPTDWARATHAIARTMFAAPEGCAEMSAHQAEMRIAANDPAAMADLWHSLCQCDLREAIRSLPVPLLAIHGAESKVYPVETAAWLERSAPQAKSIVIPDAGHSPNLEQPEAFARVVAAFMGI